MVARMMAAGRASALLPAGGKLYASLLPPDHYKAGPARAHAAARGDLAQHVVASLRDNTAARGTSARRASSTGQTSDAAAHQWRATAAGAQAGAFRPQHPGEVDTCWRRSGHERW
jgi:hypothetical protein